MYHQNKSYDWALYRKESNLLLKDSQERTNQIIVWGGDSGMMRSEKFVIWDGHNFQQEETWKN